MQQSKQMTHWMTHMHTAHIHNNHRQLEPNCKNIILIPITAFSLYPLYFLLLRVHYRRMCRYFTCFYIIFSLSFVFFFSFAFWRRHSIHSYRQQKKKQHAIFHIHGYWREPQSKDKKEKRKQQNMKAQSQSYQRNILLHISSFHISFSFVSKSIPYLVRHRWFHLFYTIYFIVKLTHGKKIIYIKLVFLSLAIFFHRFHCIFSAKWKYIDMRMCDHFVRNVLRLKYEEKVKIIKSQCKSLSQTCSVKKRSSSDAHLPLNEKKNE